MTDAIRKRLEQAEGIASLVRALRNLAEADAPLIQRLIAAGYGATPAEVIERAAKEWKSHEQ